MKRKLVLLIGGLLCLLFLMPQFRAVPQSDGEHIYHCAQEESYGDDVVRRGEYWQYREPASDATETFVVDTLLDTPVCSRIVTDPTRNVVFYQEGSVQSFLKEEDFDLRSPCWEALSTDAVSGQSENEFERVSYNVIVMSQNAPIAINYPTELLLAPAYIGQFPLLSDAPLTPYDGRGFIATIPSTALLRDQGIDTHGGRITQEVIDQIKDFYLEHLPGWLLVDGANTDFGENPYVFPGGYVGYLAFKSQTDDSVIELELSILRDDSLQLTVSTVPPAAEAPPPIPEVLTGSSNALATKSSLFIGWTGAESGANAIFLDGQIEAYHLKRGDYQWFFDLAIEPNTYEMIYSRRLQQPNTCTPTEFLPDWAKIP